MRDRSKPPAKMRNPLAARSTAMLAILASPRQRALSMRADPVEAAAEGFKILSSQKLQPFCSISTAGDAERFLESHDTFIFDCDGVLWRGDRLLPGTVETLDFLAEKGKGSIFVTNNAAKSRSAYVSRFAALGLDRVQLEQVVPSSYVAARWLRKNRPALQNAFVIGAAGLVDEMREVGINVLTARDAAFASAASNGNSLMDLAEVVAGGPSVDAVVVGHDTQFDYTALCLASLYLEQPGTVFVATNGDAYDMVADHKMPGNGCLVAAVATAAGRPPDAVCGKPAADLADYLVDAYGLEPRRTCMVGDRLDTDIALAHAMGASSLLVLTGVAGADDVLAAVEQAESPSEAGRAGGAFIPTHVASHLGRLRELCAETEVAK